MFWCFLPRKIRRQWRRRRFACETIAAVIGLDTLAREGANRVCARGTPGHAIVRRVPLVAAVSALATFVNVVAGSVVVAGRTHFVHTAVAWFARALEATVKVRAVSIGMTVR